MLSKKPKLFQLQKAVFEALTSADLSVPVLDYVPENQAYPYITIGDDSFDNDDSKLEFSDIATVEVNIYSQARGYAEVKQLLESVVGILSTVKVRSEQFDISYLDIRQLETGRMTDGITRYGTVLVVYRVSQND